MTDKTGFVVEAETIRLRLTGEFEGAWLDVVKELSLDDFLVFQRLLRADDSEETEDPKERMARLAEQAESMRAWGDNFVTDWNLERPKGTALPADGSGFLRLPAALRRAVIRTWIESIQDVPAPLELPGKNGESSEVLPTSTANRAARRAKSSRPRS